MPPPLNDTPFARNIINHYGEDGRAWLTTLPQLVWSLSSKLGLRDLKEFSNLTYNYVLSGYQEQQPIVLKLGFDREALRREASALTCFQGCGAVKVLAEDDGMLLLKRTMPGTSLKSYFPDKEHEAIDIACGVIKKLHLPMRKLGKRSHFPHIRDWLAALDQHAIIPLDMLVKARKLRDHLLQTSNPDVLLHGDLHHDNILQNGDDWLVIDPKGVIGEPCYEVAAFIRNPIPEFLHNPDAQKMIHKRIAHFAEALELPPQRILDWCFVQAVLAWMWEKEDLADEALAKVSGCKADYFATLTMLLEKLYHDKQ